MGDTCTRACAFCNVRTGRPGPLDLSEPARVGAAVAALLVLNVTHGEAASFPGVAPVLVYDAASGRVRSYVAQGAEILVSSEHENVYDFAPVVRALGLAGFRDGDELLIEGRGLYR